MADNGQSSKFIQFEPLCLICNYKNLQVLLDINIPVILQNVESKKCSILAAPCLSPPAHGVQTVARLIDESASKRLCENKSRGRTGCTSAQRVRVTQMAASLQRHDAEPVKHISFKGAVTTTFIMERVTLSDERGRVGGISD